MGHSVLGLWRSVFRSLVSIVLPSADTQLPSKIVSHTTTSSHNHDTIDIYRAVGLSADFTWINPLGFLALTIWSFGIYFSPVARREYRLRHEGHLPQVSKSDLAFALHGFLLSSFQFVQVYYYTYYYRKSSKNQNPIFTTETEEDPLLPTREDPDFVVTSQPTTRSLIFKFLIAVAWVAGIGGGAFAGIGNFTFLDWLYLVSTIKLVISIIKFIPQVLLNWRLKSSEGFSVAMPALVSVSFVTLDQYVSVG
jgi:cystinosin